MHFLFLLLSVWFDLQRPLKAHRGTSEHEIVFSGAFPSDMTVNFHSWAHYSAPTTPGEVFRPLWTKSELFTLTIVYLVLALEDSGDQIAL